MFDLLLNKDVYIAICILGQIKIRCEHSLNV